MKPFLRSQLERYAQRLQELDFLLSREDIMADMQQYRSISREHAEVTQVAGRYARYQQREADLAGAREMLQDPDMAEMAQEEIHAAETELVQLEDELQRLLLPKDPDDERNAFIEIRAGTGGDEAGIFAGDLLRMYMRYAEARRWKTEIVDENETGVGGYKEVIVAVKGKGAYSRLKFESGVHRVQRVPQTESQGRIHTSAATVAVMPELDPVDITLDERDLQITAEFSSGPGGQHMQKNATAARVVHKPTGMFVKIQSERSLSQNKQVALAIIQARLEEMEQAKQSSAEAANRKAQVGSGDRSEKIRTYNYPQSRVTDHRVGFTSYNLPVVMDGDLDPFIDALILADEAEKLAAATE